jgi:hypothetical protein
LGENFNISENNIINVELAKILGYLIFDVSYKPLANMDDKLQVRSKFR